MQENYLLICQTKLTKWASQNPTVTPLNAWDLPVLKYNPRENHEYLALMAKPVGPEEEEEEEEISSLQ